MAVAAHSALGQALGYVYQFERATYRLLESDSAVVSVAVEAVDDVSVHRADGSGIYEQDKATIADGQMLADRSVALWKTISIWADAVLNDPDLLSSTEFHLVTTGTIGADSLAARINHAVAEPEATLLAREIRRIGKDLREDLQPFAIAIGKLRVDLLAGLIIKIVVMDNVSASYGGSLDDLQCLRLLSPVQRTAIFDGAAGWVRRSVLAAAREGMPTFIDRTAFNAELKGLFRRVAVAPLAAVFDTTTLNVDPANYEAYGFFQQLDWVDTDFDFVRDCVIHYAQAQAARVKWTDTDAVSEASLSVYEEDLQLCWKLQVQRQSQRTYSSPVIQGKECLIETLSCDSSLDGQQMPKAITCGNFHTLANFDARTDPKIGWHPNFKDKVKSTRKLS
jgi:hypothetical protein